MAMMGRGSASRALAEAVDGLEMDGDAEGGLDREDDGHELQAGRGLSQPYCSCL